MDHSGEPAAVAGGCVEFSVLLLLVLEEEQSWTVLKNECENRIQIDTLAVRNCFPLFFYLCSILGLV